MNERDVAEAVKDWVMDTLSEVETGYAFPPGSKTAALPDVVALTNAKTKAPDSPAFPAVAELQQYWIRTFEMEVSLMVESDEDGGETAVQLLQSFGADLEASVEEDATLGGRVEMVSPLMRFDYLRSFVEYEDGTRGRGMAIQMVVGELIPDPN